MAARKLSPAPTALLGVTFTASKRRRPSRVARTAPSRPSVNAIISAASDAMSSRRAASWSAGAVRFRSTKSCNSPRLGLIRWSPRPLASPKSSSRGVENHLRSSACRQGGDPHIEIVRYSARQAAACDEVFALHLVKR